MGNGRQPKKISTHHPRGNADIGSHENGGSKFATGKCLPKPCSAAEEEYISLFLLQSSNPRTMR